MRLSGIITVAAILLFLAITWCHGAEPLQNKSIAVIKPGVGLGNIKIGDPLTDVIKKMGRKPSDGKTVQTGSQTEYWLNYTDMGVTFIFNEKQVLSRIVVTNPGITVQQKGIRVNSSTEDIDKIYGKGTFKSLSDKYEQRVYEKEGLNFTINKDLNKIETITIQQKR
jgi:hypothetical protein